MSELQRVEGVTCPTCHGSSAEVLAIKRGKLGDYYVDERLLRCLCCAGRWWFAPMQALTRSG